MLPYQESNPEHNQKQTFEVLRRPDALVPTRGRWLRELHTKIEFASLNNMQVNKEGVWKELALDTQKYVRKNSRRC